MALSEDPPDQGLYRGQVGTVVVDLAPAVFGAGFSDGEGRTYATLSLYAGELMGLHADL